MAEFHAPGWVAAGIRDGLSATAALRVFRDAGGTIGNSAWYSLYAEQKASTANVINETVAPLGAIPAAHEIIPWTTKRREGYVQTVDVYVREVGSSTVTTVPFMLSGDELLTRGDAVATALTQMQAAVDEGRYEEVVLGAVYTGTRQMKVGVVS